MDAEPTNEDDNGQTHAEGTATVAVASADAEEGDEVAVDGPANVEFPGGFVKADAMAFLAKWGWKPSHALMIWGTTSSSRGNSPDSTAYRRCSPSSAFLAPSAYACFAYASDTAYLVMRNKRYGPQFGS